MSRTKSIFDWIFSVNPSGYDLLYLETPDGDIATETLDARTDREAKSLNTIKEFAKEYRSLKDVWKFLSQKHDLYSAGKLVERGRHVDENVGSLVKKTYGGSR